MICCGLVPVDLTIIFKIISLPQPYNCLSELNEFKRANSITKMKHGTW